MRRDWKRPGHRAWPLRPNNRESSLAVSCFHPATADLTSRQAPPIALSFLLNFFFILKRRLLVPNINSPAFGGCNPRFSPVLSDSSVLLKILLSLLRSTTHTLWSVFLCRSLLGLFGSFICSGGLLVRAASCNLGFDFRPRHRTETRKIGSSWLLSSREAFGRVASSSAAARNVFQYKVGFGKGPTLFVA